MPLTCLHANLRFNRSYDAFHAARVRTGLGLYPNPTQSAEIARKGQPSRDGRNSYLMEERERQLARVPP